MRTEFSGASNAGRVRRRNEDAILVRPEDHLCVVADGMGGHAGGAEASRIAVDAIGEFFRRTRSPDAGTWPLIASWVHDVHACRLVSAIQYAHRSVVDAAWNQPGGPTVMGTTAVALLFAAGQAYVAHVGDSRCYRFLDGRLVQLTTDHSVVEDIKRRYQLTRDQQASLGGIRHLVARALGGRETGDVEVDLSMVVPSPGELFLLCTDGLSNELSGDAIAGILSTTTNLQEAADRLIGAAVAAGGADNISVVLGRFLAGDGDEEILLFQEEDTQEVTTVAIPSR
ncbi:MAG: serine/threonine-protein phosphatase [Deltaproteobacteria bacterium]|nr:serine/threonine-protein phosphatase [Deltaproteobacteria bacterium]